MNLLQNPSIMKIAADAIKTLGEESKPLTVEAVNNHVYFYSPVNPDRCLALIRQLREIDGTLRNERLSRNIPDDYPPTPIWLHIHSGGGDMFAALAFIDQLQTIATPIFSIAEGLCASAATFIAMACKRRYVTPNSFMLIHQFSTWMAGTHESFKDEMRLQDMLIAKMVEFYTGHSKMDAEQVREMLKRDYWLDASECLEKGLADEIL